MDRNLCVDGKLNDDNNYSSPMPMIGLYIAAATLVCLLFMFLDILSAYRNRKRWIPCRFFSLNSVTLTLLSVATKLPLDLTTSMPSVYDQLSKLTGTTLICICMSFLMPSLGASRDSECLTNMIALTIFAITVFVNICIQLHTGVIILFRVENIIILCFMISLLVLLWNCVFRINQQKEFLIDHVKDHFTNGPKSILHRLKICSLYGYSSNPQFRLCRESLHFSVCTISMLCSVVLLQVVFRCLVSQKFKFCKGFSDYSWSMKIIVVSQIITILVGCMGSTFRLLSMIFHIDFVNRNVPVEKAESIISRSPIVQPNTSAWFTTLVYIPMVLFSFFIEMLFVLVQVPVAIVLQRMMRNSLSKDGDDEAIKEFKDLIHVEMVHMGLDEWTLRNGVKDMKTWIYEINKTKASDHLIKLLSATTTPCQEDPSLNNMHENECEPRRPVHKVSSLSIFLLVKIATMSIPSSLSQPLLGSLNEVFEVLHFVDRRMSSSSFEIKQKTKLAKVLWERGNNFDRLLGKIDYKLKYSRSSSQLDHELEQAIRTIEVLKEALPLDTIRNEMAIITSLIIEQRVYESIEELYGYMEQLFAEWVNAFLTYLPNAIYQEITESHPEECEERVRLALKVLCRVEKLEAFVRWSFPPGTTITSLITDQDVPETNASDHNRDFGHDIDLVIQDEVIQVEEIDQDI